MIPFKQRLFQLFGNYDKLIDSYKDSDGKGLEERFQETIGESADTELVTLIANFFPNAIEARTVWATLLPYAERMLGYDDKNLALQLGTSVEWHRRILEGMVKYYRIKGTRRCYELLFELAGLSVEITEYWPDQTFDDPVLTLDDPARPLLDMGRCDPCSRYSIAILGNADFSEVSVAVSSIIAFNEPINAYQGVLTYNGQEFTPGGELQGEPCPHVNLNVNMANVLPGFSVRVDLGADQAADFEPGWMTYSVDGGEPVIATTPLAGGPPVYMGPFEFNSQIVVRIGNNLRPLCVTQLGPMTMAPACTYPSLVEVTPVSGYLNVIIPDSALPLPEGFTTNSIRYSENGGPQMFAPFIVGSANGALIGPFPMGSVVDIWIDNNTNENCNYYTGSHALTIPCVGEGYGSVTFGDEEDRALFITSSTFHHAARNSVTGVVTMDLDVFEPNSSYCFWACDEEGNKTGYITEVTCTGASSLNVDGLTELRLLLINVLTGPELPSLTENIRLVSLYVYGCPSISSLPSLATNTFLTELTIYDCQSLSSLTSLDTNTMLAVLNISACPSLTALPSFDALTALQSLHLEACGVLAELPSLAMCTELIILYLTDCQALTEIPSLETNTLLGSFQATSMPLMTVLPSLATNSQLKTLYIQFMPAITALPDFHPDATILYCGIRYSNTIASVGVLPKFFEFILQHTNVTDSAVMDAFVNALDPVATGGSKLADFGGTLSIRTSASDANYAACIAGGWVFTP